MHVQYHTIHIIMRSVYSFIKSYISHSHVTNHKTHSDVIDLVKHGNLYNTVRRGFEFRHDINKASDSSSDCEANINLPLPPPSPSQANTPTPTCKTPPIPTWTDAAANVSNSSSEGSSLASLPATNSTPTRPPTPARPTTPIPPHHTRRQTRSMTAETRLTTPCQRQKSHIAVKAANKNPRRPKRKRYLPKPSKRPKRVKISKSRIANAGLGLYLLEPAKVGEFVTRYSGQAISRAENQVRTGHYRIRISSNLYLDAEKSHHFEGR